MAVYPSPVKVGTFKVPTGGTIDGVPADGQTVNNVSFNVTKQKAVLQEDITWVGQDGQKRTVKAGTVVNPQDIEEAKKYTGKEPKFEYKYISEGYTDDNQIVNVDAELIAPASVASLKGQTGKGALGVYQEKSNKQLQEKGSKNTTGGAKTTSVPNNVEEKDLDFSVVKTSKDDKIDQFFDYNGKNYRYERGTNNLYENGKLIKTIKETSYITPVIGDYYVEGTLGDVGRLKQGAKTTGVAKTTSGGASRFSKKK